VLDRRELPRGEVLFYGIAYAYQPEMVRPYRHGVVKPPTRLRANGSQIYCGVAERPHRGRQVVLPRPLLVDEHALPLAIGPVLDRGDGQVRFVHSVRL
jgi:hypothetical protein